YSFWDYRNLDFPRNNGLRIDHILATAPLAARCLSATIDRDERKGDKPSDHAPVVAVFQD
ncbi:MAG: endonuclease/exonuclease/phosphatase family protein, partial [Planctomycetota bacterium]